jgi:hypothetical protein
MAEANSTFILRLWMVDTSLATPAPRGRGRIDHLQSGEYCYFECLAEAMHFIGAHFGAFSAMQPPEPGTATSTSTMERSAATDEGNHE